MLHNQASEGRVPSPQRHGGGSRASVSGCRRIAGSEFSPLGAGCRRIQMGAAWATTELPDVGRQPGGSTASLWPGLTSAGTTSTR